jgi:hypothetical protein
VTREERVFVGVDEIRALRWTCSTCRVAISYPLDQTIRLPRNCPSCNADAVDDPNFRPQHAAYHRFVDAVKTLRATESTLGDHAPGRLQMEFLSEPRR